MTPVALAYFFLGGSDLTDGAFCIKRRVDLKLWIPAVGTSVMLVLYLALIPRFKVVGAVYATPGGTCSGWT